MTYNASEIDRLVREGTEDSNGFAGEFAFQPTHTEDHGIGNIADCIDIDDRLIYIPRVDADTDEYVTIASPIDRHVAEPLARMLNRHCAMVAALSAAKAEVERLRIALDQARELSGIKQWAEDVKLSCKYAAERDRLAAEVKRLTMGSEGLCDGYLYEQKRADDLSAEVERLRSIAEAQSKLLAELPPSADQLIMAEMAAATARAERDAANAASRRLSARVREQDEQIAHLVNEAGRDSCADFAQRCNARVRELELTEEEREAVRLCSVHCRNEQQLKLASGVLDRLVKGGR